ncbi:uncharacterized protein EI90DRAFT_888391 [Cantharellus anzutake]|uniref:uncharacterized protein n=1 Tax=Cantharellus anzutake TaxID=1750568 RepID=UPI00190458C0|nr:uncharacterized protein EI90DRAFT_888391 [Cantharellus anzutake]KAF8331836.1 hypothetical protein EI90DRAFT_888391 [Cantharellus anzutake]
MDENRFSGRYNIAPRSNIPVIRRESTPPEDPHARMGSLILHTMKWGIVPHFTKHDGSLNTINARSEHLMDGTSALWNSLKSKKRALVPAQGYFEWLKKGNHRIPYFTKYKDDHLMLFAGLWDVVYHEGSQEPSFTVTIVTTQASKRLAFLHDRMPLILSSQEDIELWLSPEDWSQKLCGLLHSNESDFDCYPVPKEVGKVGTNSPTFFLPVSQRRDGIEAFFQNQRMKVEDTQSRLHLSQSQHGPADEDDDLMLPKPKKQKIDGVHKQQNGKITEYFPKKG